MASRRYQVIAYRGVSAHAPENTRAAFDLAVSQGVDGIQFDVRLSSDGAAVLCHDDTVDRTSDGKGRVGELTIENLKALDFGAWRDPSFAGQKVLTLGEMFDEYAGRTCSLIVEVKERGLAIPVVKEVQRRGIYDRVLVTGFLREVLTSIRTLDPKISCGWLLTKNSTVTPIEVKNASFVYYCPHVADLTHGVVDDAHGVGLLVFPWGVANLSEAERMLDYGVDSFGYDDPGDLIGLLKKKGLR